MFMNFTAVAGKNTQDLPLMKYTAFYFIEKISYISENSLFDVIESLSYSSILVTSCKPFLFTGIVQTPFIKILQQFINSI